MSNTYTITQINTYIKSSLENDKNLKNISLVGEISNFTNHYKTGHFYLTLKDEDSTMKVVMFKNYANLITFEPENGMKVVVKGNVSVYVKNGNYQMTITEMLPFGEGSCNLAFNKLKEKLEKKGVFDLRHKKIIDKNPSTIALITAVGSAALKDVLSVIERRNPFCKIIIYGAIMQGVNSPNSVINNIILANQNDEIDVIIIARGGGSTEDLFCFNDENLAMTTFNSKKPIISAIGHDVDYTILDYVADVRAATPSVAGELIVDNLRGINFNSIKDSLKNKLLLKFVNYDKLLLNIKNYDRLNDVKALINKKQLSLDDKKAVLNREFLNILHKKQNLLDNKVSVFKAVNLNAVLKRGYSITTINDEVVNINNINVGDNIITNIDKGRVHSKIIKIDRKD